MPLKSIREHVREAHRWSKADANAPLSYVIAAHGRYYPDCPFIVSFSEREAA